LSKQDNGGFRQTRDNNEESSGNSTALKNGALQRAFWCRMNYALKKLN